MAASLKWSNSTKIFNFFFSQIDFTCVVNHNRNIFDLLKYRDQSRIPAVRKRDLDLPGWNFLHVIARYNLRRVITLLGSPQNETEFHPGKPGSCNHHHLRYISIDRTYFYCVVTTHITSICEKKINNDLDHLIIIEPLRTTASYFMKNYKDTAEN